MDYLSNLELSTADYVELEIAEAMEAAGDEWRGIAEREGYYEPADEVTAEENETLCNRFTFHD